MIGIWIIVILLLIILFFWSRYLNKKIFDEMGLKPKVLKYTTFSFFPIILLLVIPIVIIFCKQEAINFLIDNLYYLKDVPSSFIKIVSYIIKVSFYFSWVIAFPTVLLASLFFLREKGKIILLSICYLILFFIAWAFSWGSIGHYSGLIKPEEGLIWTIKIIYNNIVWIPSEVSSLLLMLSIAFSYYLNKKTKTKDG